MHANITYPDIDWNVLWQNAREQKSWTQKGPKDWDKKAPSFLKRNSKSPFIELVLEKLPLQDEFSILDAGSGPGTLSIPLAKKVQSVTALDYSQGMLEALAKEAAAQRINNINMIHGSWEDDWQTLGITQHDICIASRSLSVPNLAQSLAKLDQYSRRYVFVVDRIGNTPFDEGAFKALSRPFRTGPDYIYTVNTLYSMGIYCSVDIISLPAETQYQHFEAALDSYIWMFKELTPQEKNQLQDYIRSNSRLLEDGQVIVKRSAPPRWAVISWETEA